MTNSTFSTTRSTGTAAETFYNRKGNCLAISNLFIAAARHLGLEASYKTLSVRPTWEQAGLTLIRYEHIIAIGKLDSVMIMSSTFYRN